MAGVGGLEVIRGVVASHFTQTETSTIPRGSVGSLQVPRDITQSVTWRTRHDFTDSYSVLPASAARVLAPFLKLLQ